LGTKGLESFPVAEWAKIEENKSVKSRIFVTMLFFFGV
jgi:hypothetical protein